MSLRISYLVLIVVVTFPNHHQASFLTWVALGNQAFVGLEVIQLWKEKSLTVRVKNSPRSQSVLKDLDP